MIGINVNNYQRTSDTHNHERAMDFSSDTESSTSSLISTTNSLFCLDECNSKDRASILNNSNLFAKNDNTESSKHFDQSALNQIESGIYKNRTNENEDIIKSMDGLVIKDVNNSNNKSWDKASATQHNKAPDSNESIFNDTSQKQHISKSAFESNLENLSHDDFDSDLQKRKLNNDDYIYCDMTSTDDLDYNAHHYITDENKSPLSEEANFSFVEEVENFEKLSKQSPQICRNKQKPKSFEEDQNEENIIREKKPNKKGHTVCFADQLSTVHSCLLDPWKEVLMSSREELQESYENSCIKNSISPSPQVIKQLQEIPDTKEKVDVFSLNDLMLSMNEVDALEEIFKRICINQLHMKHALQDEHAAMLMFDLLSYYESCDHLVLTANKDIKTLGWQAVANFLKQTSSLVTFEGRDLIIQEYSIACFFKGVESCSNLQSISLNSSVSSNRQLTLLESALKNNENIKKVCLSGNRFGVSDAPTLANIMKRCQHLVTFDLSHNSLADQGGAHIFGALNDSNITHLDLSYNDFTRFSMSVLSRAVKHSSRLQSLILDGNKLNDEGVHKLKDALAHNKSLLHLSMQEVGLSHKGVNDLSHFIGHHPTLQHLNLLGNNFNQDAIISLCKSVLINHTITKVDFDMNEENLPSEVDVADDKLMKDLLEEMKDHIDKNRRKHLKDQIELSYNTNTHNNFEELASSYSEDEVKKGETFSSSSFTSISSHSPKFSLSAALSASLTALNIPFQAPFSESGCSNKNGDKNIGSERDDGLPSYTEAVKQLNIPIINFNDDKHVPSKQTANNIPQTLQAPLTINIPSPDKRLEEFNDTHPPSLLTTVTSTLPNQTSPNSVLPLSTTPNTSPKLAAPTISSETAAPAISPLLASPSLAEVDVRLVNSPRSKKKFRVSTLGSPLATSPNQSPNRLSSHTSSSLLTTPSSSASSIINSTSSI